MILWFVLPIIMGIAMLIYLHHWIYKGLQCFCPVWKKGRRRIVSVLVLLLILTPMLRDSLTWMLVLLHLTAFLLLSDLVVFIWRRTSRRKNHADQTREETPNHQQPKPPVALTGREKIYRSGIIAILLTACIMGYGVYNISNVVRTEYTVPTAKDIRASGYRVALLSDLHYGISLDDDELRQEVERINGENPDIVVLAGDIVDESTTRSQMESAFTILGNLRSTYGTYYIYGNHDKNNYSRELEYTVEDLNRNIEKAGIHILEDDSATIHQEVTLVGRGDMEEIGFTRKSAEELLSKADPKQELVVIDHVPADYTNVAKAGGDLILSGHTHGGQIWPAGLLMDAFHINELSYGEKKIGNLTGLVTSGIAGWGFPIRTEKHSEYVIINIVPEK